MECSHANACLIPARSLDANVSRHTGQLIACVLRTVLATSDVIMIQPEPAKVIPDCIDNEGRLAFVEIGKRAASEHAHLYSILCVGCETYLLARQ